MDLKGTPVPSILQRNVIFGGCLLWLHKKYSGVKGPLHQEFMFSLDAWDRHSGLMVDP